MLDRVNPELLERLLGDDFHGHVADRVSLTSVRIDGGPTFKNPEGEAGETLTFDEPVDMVRLHISGMKVWNTLDGWPAALTMPYGEGSLSSPRSDRGPGSGRLLPARQRTMTLCRNLLSSLVLRWKISQPRFLPNASHRYC